jgi:hypothetical protein
METVSTQHPYTPHYNTSSKHKARVLIASTQQQQIPHWQHICITFKTKSGDCLLFTAIDTTVSSSAHHHKNRYSSNEQTPKKKKTTLSPWRMVHQCSLRCEKHISNSWTARAKYYTPRPRRNSLHHGVENTFLTAERQQRNTAVIIKVAVHQCLSSCREHIIFIKHFIPLMSTNFSFLFCASLQETNAQIEKRK